METYYDYIKKNTPKDDSWEKMVALVENLQPKPRKLVHEIHEKKQETLLTEKKEEKPVSINFNELEKNDIIRFDTTPYDNKGVYFEEFVSSLKDIKDNDEYKIIATPENITIEIHGNDVVKILKDVLSKLDEIVDINITSFDDKFSAFAKDVNEKFDYTKQKQQSKMFKDVNNGDVIYFFREDDSKEKIETETVVGITKESKYLKFYLSNNYSVICWNEKDSLSEGTMRNESDNNVYGFYVRMSTDIERLKKDK